MKPFEKLFSEADAMGKTDDANLDCFVAVKHLRALVYAGDDMKAAKMSYDVYRRMFTGLTQTAILSPALCRGTTPA